MPHHYIYVVFSATPYRIGKAIRRITGEPYNHISIALDEDLGRIYSFARRYYHTPLYGGFVRESLSRYHVKGQSAQVHICKLPVTAEQFRSLEALLEEMHHQQDQYLYNHISALGAVVHKTIRAKHAYTCVEFCVKVLHSLGEDLDPGKYYSIGDVLQKLSSHAVYTGPMPHPADFDTTFYAKKPISSPTLTTLREMFKLFPRLGA